MRCGLPLVAPSRARGLKQFPLTLTTPRLGRALTGAWIETVWQPFRDASLTGRALTGAWIETDH